MQKSPISYHFDKGFQQDGLRAINNAINDKAVIPGAAAFEVRAFNHLMKYKDTVKGKEVRLGIQAFAEALLVIPQKFGYQQWL